MQVLRSSLFVAVATLACAAATPALATSESFASISNFTVHTAGLSVDPPILYLRATVKDNFGTTLQEQIRVTSSNDPVTADMADTNATTAITGNDFSTATFMAQGHSSSDKRYDAISYASLTFTVAARTLISFGARSTLSASFDQALGESAYAGTYFAIRDELPTTSVQSDSMSVAGALRTTKLSTFYENNTDSAVTKMLVIGAFVQGESFPVTPVPEPETYAMLLAGLGVLGAVARRRKAQANA